MVKRAGKKMRATIHMEIGRGKALRQSQNLHDRDTYLSNTFHTPKNINQIIPTIKPQSGDCFLYCFRHKMEKTTNDQVRVSERET